MSRPDWSMLGILIGGALKNIQQKKLMEQQQPKVIQKEQPNFQEQPDKKKQNDIMMWVTVDPKNPYLELATYRTPDEKMLFILDDGSALVVGGGTKREISLPLGKIRGQLAKKGKNWNNIISVIHNHGEGEDFSGADSKVDAALRALGFTGQFQAYHPKTGQVRTLKKEVK